MIKLFCTGKVTPKTLETPQHGVQCVDKKNLRKVDKWKIKEEVQSIHF